MIEYRTLSVRIEALHEDRYKAIVRGPDGDGQAEFELPFDGAALDALATAVSRPRAARRRIESDESAAARAFGERLFDLIFQDTARDVLRAAVSQARRDNQGLRVMLQLDGARQLRNAPWELLNDSTRFMSTSSYTPVLRYVDLPSRPPPLSLRPPLRILGMVSSPGDMPTLDAEGEREHLAEACRSLTDRGLVEIDWVSEGTLGGLLRCLNDGDYHIFHFIGHGDFDEQAEDGVLLFEGRAGLSHRVTGVDLGTILADQHTLRLAVINACEGARVAPDSNGVAASLMRYGLPAVIAMQFEISDEAAIAFAQHFYESVARSHPIDEALTDARKGMYANGHGLEWATPVLFTSIDDGRLFDVGWEKLGSGQGKNLESGQEKLESGQEKLESGQEKLESGQEKLESGQRTGQGKSQELDGSATVKQGVVSRKSGEDTKSDGDGSAVVKQGVEPRKSEQDKSDSGENTGPRWSSRAIGGALAALVIVTVAILVFAGIFSGNSGPSVGKAISVGRSPVGIAVGQGQVWVTSSDVGTVTGIDPSTGAIIGKTTVEEDPNSVAVDPKGYVWVALLKGGQVAWIDPRSHKVVDQRSVGAEPNTIAVGMGAAWVTNSGEGTVSRIDLHTYGVSTIEGVGIHTSGIGVGYGSVWVARSGARTVTLIDPAKEVVTKTIHIKRSTQGIAVGGGAVWVADPLENTVSRIDPRSGKIKRIAVGPRPSAIAADSSGIWVANSGGSVSRIDPGTYKAGKPIPVEGQLNDIAVGSGTVWVTNLFDSTVVPIKP